MEKGMKQNIILLVLVTLLLLANIIYAICQSIDYEARKDSVMHDGLRYKI